MISNTLDTLITSLNQYSSKADLVLHQLGKRWPRIIFAGNKSDEYSVAKFVAQCAEYRKQSADDIGVLTQESFSEVFIQAENMCLALGDCHFAETGLRLRSEVEKWSLELFDYIRPVLTGEPDNFADRVQWSSKWISQKDDLIRDIEMAKRLILVNQKNERSPSLSNNHKPQADRSTFTVYWQNKSCSLGSTSPFYLFEYLAKQFDKYVSIEDVIDNVWDYKKCQDSNVRKTAQKLRKALEASAIPLTTDGKQSGYIRLTSSEKNSSDSR